MPKLPLEKQYGDQTVLDKFRSATKPLPISGAPAPKRGPGRPAGQAAPAPAATPAGGGGVLPEQLSMMKRLHQAEEVAAYWINRAQTIPDPYTKMYAQRAISVRNQLALRLYRGTPNFFS